MLYMRWEIGNKAYIKLLEKFLSHSVNFISEGASWSISELKKMCKKNINFLDLVNSKVFE